MPLRRLSAIYDRLNDDRQEDSFEFNPGMLAAPLPRAYQWCDGSAYLRHAELVRQARGAEMPATLYTDPLLYQGGSDTFLSAVNQIPLVDEAWGLDLEGKSRL